MLSIIVAKSKNNVIGKNNSMLWKLPDDLRQFKEKTTGHVIIMGRKTFESLGRVLPNREHIVLSRNQNFTVDSEFVKVAHSISDLQKYIDDKNENFVIGGTNIYNLLMPFCTKMYITQLQKDFEGDATFPNIDEAEWEEVSRENGPKDENNDFEYEYITYVRKNK